MPERIVLAIDGGVASAAALEWTISRAANTDLHVRLMTIDESAVPVTESSQRLEAVRALDHAAGRFAELAPRSKIEMVLFRGKAVDVLARESVAADLVVIGSHGSSVLSGVFRVTVPLGLAPRSSLPRGDRACPLGSVGRPGRRRRGRTDIDCSPGARRARGRTTRSRPRTRTRLAIGADGHHGSARSRQRRGRYP